MPRAVAEVDQEAGQPGPGEVGVRRAARPRTSAGSGPSRTGPGARPASARRRGSPGVGQGQHDQHDRGDDVARRDAARSPPRCRTPPTTPRVWAIARKPPTRPRAPTGTWSGTVAVTAASIAFSDAWTPHQAEHHHRHRVRDRRAPAATGRRRAAPPSTQGSRRPIRSVVRSEKAPKTGLQITVETTRPEAEDQREDLLLVLGVDRLGLLREQHRDRAEEAGTTARCWPG